MKHLPTILAVLENAHVRAVCAITGRRPESLTRTERDLVLAEHQTAIAEDARFLAAIARQIGAEIYLAENSYEPAPAFERVVFDTGEDSLEASP